jgi:hypothetical protein
LYLLFSTAQFAAAVPLASAGCGVAALVWGFRRLAGTTLRAPWWWAAISLTTAAIGEAAIVISDAGDSAAAAQFRLAAGSLTFCPLVALLGAKRPQDRAWQFIVFSFWVILALPAAQVRLLRPDDPPSVHALWSWFFVVLIVVGLTNYLATRFFLAALLAAAGQATYLWTFLPFAAHAESQVTFEVGLALSGAALAVAAFLAALPQHTREPLDRLWLDFRDQFGVVWGLRIAERINASAKMYGWNTQLNWHGFSTVVRGRSEAISSAAKAELEKSLRSLLRRFVSDHWIDRRVAGVSPPGEA